MSSSTTTTPKPLNILALIFPNFNILDLTGPVEVLCNSRIPATSRTLTIASASKETRSYEDVTLTRNTSFSSLRTAEIENYDMLLIPGAVTHGIEGVLEDDQGFLNVIETFAALRHDVKERWVFSVCSGAALLAKAGVLRGKTATTHWAFVDFVRRLCDEAGEGTQIVRKRWVSSGRMGEDGPRVVTAGGVSCGIDAALWIAREIWGAELVGRIAEGMDYRWEFEDVRVEGTKEWVV